MGSSLGGLDAQQVGAVTPCPDPPQISRTQSQLRTIKTRFISHANDHHTPGETGPGETRGLQGKQNSWILQNRRRGIWQQWLLIGSEIWAALEEAQISVESCAARENWQYQEL